MLIVVKLCVLYIDRREIPHMDWNAKLQKILDYTEDCLQRQEKLVSKEKVSEIADCSYPFFQKVFSYMNGISFSEYVRSRKMTLAGYDLKSAGIKIIDLSYKYGYESPTSFTKAFQQFHGVSPKEARAADVNLRVYPKMKVKETDEYSWRLERKSAFRLVGKSVVISNKDQQHFKTIPAFWDRCQKDGTFSQLIAMDEAAAKGMMGLFQHYDGHAGTIEYAIMVTSSRPAPPGLAELEIPEMTWAVFDCVGAVPQAIHRGWKFLNEEWLTRYPFQHADCPEIEWYSNGNSYSEEYLSQIWIPILEEE